MLRCSIHSSVRAMDWCMHGGPTIVPLLRCSLNVLLIVSECFPCVKYQPSLAVSNSLAHAYS